MAAAIIPGNGPDNQLGLQGHSMHLEEKFDNKKVQNGPVSTFFRQSVNVPQVGQDRDSSKEYEAIILAKQSQKNSKDTDTRGRDAVQQM